MRLKPAAPAPAALGRRCRSPGASAPPSAAVTLTPAAQRSWVHPLPRPGRGCTTRCCGLGNGRRYENDNST
ncbi:hypothetical protein Y1Q_0019529 [Alligator mississippiensis]|uniref:Uncharacterized protein n=1 Tax=Alligator mississippiensis TaxID=8496 RepID=A0A151NN46_ALLMI|nr:hypothetical protein Y1Q_0019529 [Alligator mississippiensis]